MRSIAVLTVVAIVGAFAVVHSLPEGDAYADPAVVKTKEVHGISIDGLGLPMAALRDAMETEVGAVVDTETLERDRLALTRALADRGYLAAKVAPPIVTFGGSGGALVVFDIDRGPLYHVRTISLDGQGWTAGVMPIVSGDEASVERLERVRQAVQATLVRHGTQLRVGLAVEADHDDAMIDVRYSTR